MDETWEGTIMDKYDKEQLNHVYERGVSSKAISWRNPDNNNTYQVTPQPAYRNSQQRDCRQAEIIATNDITTVKEYVTACRNSDGHWVVIN